MHDVFLGADLGGSHIAVAAVDREGAILDKIEDKLTRAETQDEIIQRIVALPKNPSEEQVAKQATSPSRDWRHRCLRHGTRHHSVLT